MSDEDKALGMSPLREAMVTAHETYLAAREGGFTRSEALELIARMVMATVIETPPDE